MALYTATHIYIAKEKLTTYKSLELVQDLEAHHDLKLVCSTMALDRLSLEMRDKSKTYLGKLIDIEISPKVNTNKSYGTLRFVGVITQVESTKGFRMSKGDFITIYAKSGSILAENGANYASHSNASLLDILEHTFRPYNQALLKTNFTPTTAAPIHYSVQQGESAFAYASRLAATYNQWLYYDGAALVFGQPSTKETVLSYSEGLIEFSLAFSTIAHTATYIATDYMNNTVHETQSAQVNLPTTGEHHFANETAKAVFGTPTQIQHHLPNTTNAAYTLDTQVADHTKARAMHQIIAKGTSDNPAVQLGTIIKVEGQGRYRITKVTHSNSNSGHYTNSFEAVDAAILTYPKTDVTRFPKSSIETGVVTDNNDPEGLSRVKVQLPWQKALRQSTPWIRVMTPHAGADKGFHFIPELGESVVVNFEGGHAEHPFVQGALYHGEAKPNSWQSPTNAIKAIRTRSGHAISLNDTKGSEKIIISDKSSNLIEFDTATGSIVVSAPENLILQGKNIDIRATENLNITTGKNKTEQIAGDYKVTAANIFEVASKDMKTQGERINHQSMADMNVSSTGGNVNKQADKKVNNNSGEQGNVF